MCIRVGSRGTECGEGRADDCDCGRGDHIAAWFVAGLAAQTAVAYSQTCGVVAETWLAVALACCDDIRTVTECE